MSGIARQSARRLRPETLQTGFIPLLRSADTMDLLKDPVAFALLALIAIRARFTDSRIGGLRQGQMVLGRASAATDLGISEGQARRALARLVSAGFIAIKAASRGTVVTLADPAIFDIGIGVSSQLDGQQTASRQPAGGQPTASNEEGRKENEESSQPTAPLASRDLLFTALAIAEGSDPRHLTKSATGKISSALAEILKASPDVTPDQINARAMHYPKVMPAGTTLTAFALAKHWARCRRESQPSETEIPEPHGWREFVSEKYPGFVFNDPANEQYARTWKEVPREHRQRISAEMTGARPETLHPA